MWAACRILHVLLLKRNIGDWRLHTSHLGVGLCLRGAGAECRCDSGVQVTDTMSNCSSYLATTTKILIHTHARTHTKELKAEATCFTFKKIHTTVAERFLSFFFGDIVGRRAFFFLHKFQGKLLRRTSRGEERRRRGGGGGEGGGENKGPAHIWTTPSAHAENLAAAFTVQISGEFYSLLW